MSSMLYRVKLIYDISGECTVWYGRLRCTIIAGRLRYVWLKDRFLYIG